MSTALTNCRAHQSLIPHGPRQPKLGSSFKWPFSPAAQSRRPWPMLAPTWYVRAVSACGVYDWVRAVQQFDDATHQHCLIVAALSAAFSGVLGLRSADRHRLTRAALLHDVGKIHVPIEILNKPGRLTHSR